MNHIRLWSGIGVLSLAAGLAGGCAAPGSSSQPAAVSSPSQRNDPYLMTVQEVEKAPLESDIGAVHASYGLFPWVQFDPADPRPQGFAISALYLISNRTEQGVFGNGTITVRMFRIERQADGRQERALVHTWQFDPGQAMPYRAVRRTAIGRGYMLPLRWPAEVDVLNQEIMVVVEFVRPDGKVISSRPKFLKVPAKING